MSHTGSKLASLLTLLLFCGCSDAAPPPPPDEPPQMDPAELLAQFTPPAPGHLTITVDPDVRAWNLRGDEWVVEATIVLTNDGAAPLDVDPSLLRFRDQAHVLHANARPGASMDRSRLGPHARRSIDIMASPIRPGDRGQPSELLVDYGYSGAMTDVVTAPVTPAASTGLVAHFSNPSVPQRVARPAVGHRETQFAWRVRLRVEFTNPTDHLVRRPFGQLTAQRENGTFSYWGDHAGVSADLDWFSPGDHASGQVTLMFPDSEHPPRRITLRYAGGRPQHLDVPTSDALGNF